MIDYAIAIRSLSTGCAPVNPESIEPDPSLSAILRPDLITRNQLDSNRIYWYDEFMSLFENAYHRGLVNDLIVHGSHGDFTTTNFSDIEITVYLTEQAVSCGSKTRDLALWIKKDLHPFILSVDPLQHHGAFYLWPTLISSYDQCILPVSAYDKSWSITGCDIPLGLVDNRKEFLTRSATRFNQTLVALLRYESTFLKMGPSLYGTKRLLSNFFMLPVFYFQARGLLVNKKKALAMVSEAGFPEEFLMAMAAGTGIRKAWPIKPTVLGCIRRHLVRDQIPQGKLDRFVCAVLKDEQIADMMKSEFIPYMIAGCKKLQMSVL